jgi:hypothetical protein
METTDKNERQVFTIDVGTLTPEQLNEYIAQVKEAFTLEKSI